MDSQPLRLEPARALPSVGNALPSDSPRATDLRTHGIAVHKGSALSLRATRDPVDGKDYVYIGITTFPGLVVQIDVKSGKSRQFNLSNGGGVGPWGMAVALDGCLLVTGTNGMLYRINPREGSVREIHKFKQWLWTIDRGADGKYYLGGSPSADLYRYDDLTGQVETVTSFGSHDKYLRAIVASPDGYLYLSIGCERSQIAAHHLATGKSRFLLPKAEVGPDFHALGRGVDGQVYVRTIKGNYYRLSHGEAFKLDAEAFEREQASRFSAFATGRLADGRPVTYLDPDTIRVGEGKAAKLISYTYKTDGAAIFHLAEGPGRSVYASTIMPLYMLRYTPETKKLENLGRGGPDNGEAYSIGHCRGKVYYATYSTGKLMEYDPGKPWHKDLPGAMKWASNPKLIGDLGEGHCRPRAMTVDVKHRVWVGSHAEYGRRHGGLMFYDTIKRKMHNNPVVIPDQSVQCLAADDTGDIIYGGTDICRGSGMTPSTKEAHLFAWDARRQKLLWKQIAIPGQTGYMNLLYHQGKLYGTSRMRFTFFCFDPATRKMDYIIDSKIDACREESMTLGPDGAIYGITYTDLFRWEPETGKVESLWKTPQEELKHFPGGSMFHRGAVINNGRFYFSSGPAVLSVKLPK